MHNSKLVLPLLVLSLITVGNATAVGNVDVDLRCKSPSQSIINGIGKNSYEGIEDRYEWSIVYPSTESSPSHESEKGYVDVIYRGVKPYVLRDDVFKANPNYYRTGMSGSGSEGWWIFEDSDSADFPPRQYHQYATPTPSKNSAVTGTGYGQIKLTYKRYDGTTEEKIVNVQIQKRECEAYNNGKWREVSAGRWEQP